VAGDRGRSSNFVHGSAKAGLAVCWHRRACHYGKAWLHSYGTQDMKLPAILTANPAQVAKHIYQEVESSRVEVIYIPRVWRAIMIILRVVPERVFKHLGV
jgi:hypothetical protein